MWHTDFKLDFNCTCRSVSAGPRHYRFFRGASSLEPAEFRQKPSETSPESSRDQHTVNTQVQPVFCVLASVPGSGFCGVVDSNKLSSSACSSNHGFPAFEASEVSYLHRWQFVVVELLLYGR